MKTLIVFATKHGATGEIAQRIAKKIDNATIHNLNQNGISSVLDYDCIIIGSPLYAGSIRKEVKLFLSQHADSLRGKNLGLFLSGFNSENKQVYFENNYSMEILQAAKAKYFLGGIFDPKKAGIFERLIFKAVAKQAGYTNTIDDSLIGQLVKDLQS